MRIAILGAGAIGSFIGGGWRAAGADVRLIGRPGLVDGIAAHGLTLLDRDGRSTRVERIAATADPAAMASCDLVAVTVKHPALAAAARDLARHAAPDATVIAFQNGIGAAERLAAASGRDVVSGLFGANVVALGEGRFRRTTIGGVHVAETPATRRLAALVAGSLAPVATARDMAPIAWGKLLLNLNNAVNALSGLGLRDQLSSRDHRRVLAAAQRELLGLLGAAGIAPARLGPVSPRALPRLLMLPTPLVRPLMRIDAHARSSMADDFAAGRPSEVDALNGAVVALAGRLGRRAPVNAALVRLVHDAERGGRRAWSGADLRAAVLG